MKWLFLVVVLVVVLWFFLRRKESQTVQASGEEGEADRMRSGMEQFLAGKRDAPSPRQKQVVDRTMKEFGLGPSSEEGANRLRQLEVMLQVGDHEATLGHLLEALRDHDPAICHWAARWAGQQQRTDAVRPLVALLEKTGPTFMYARKAAARSLGQIGDTQALEPLREAYSAEKVPGVREAMGEAINTLLGRPK